MIYRGLLAATLVACLALPSCVTPDNGRAAPEPKAEPPKIAADMPLNKALEAGIDFGGDTLTNVKRLVKRRKEGQQAAKLLAEALHKGMQKYEHHQLLNAGHLYASMPSPVSPALFDELLGSGRPLAVQLAWQLAAIRPSRALGAAIDKELTRAIAENDEETVMLPQMANAVAANHLRGSYTLIRQGLMAKGDEEFAQAMIALEPKRAADDFLLYLAQAPADELRQLTLSSVNLYTCLAILKHMQKTPPSVSTANFDHLFAYAVSRNVALAELGQNIIETYVPHSTDLIAQILARQPEWVQIAYFENARRRMNPKEGLLLSELKKTTAESDVVAEIDEIKF